MLSRFPAMSQGAFHFSSGPPTRIFSRIEYRDAIRGINPPFQLSTIETASNRYHAKIWSVKTIAVSTLLRDKRGYLEPARAPRCRHGGEGFPRITRSPGECWIFRIKTWGAESQGEKHRNDDCLWRGPENAPLHESPLLETLPVDFSEKLE
jgi:hypothetical protein